MVQRRTALIALLVFVGSVALTTGLGTLINAASEGQRAADRARDQAQAQASIVADQRAAQSRRIDILRDQVDELRERLATQATLVGRQEQAIRDLAAQVSHGGQQPVVTSVAPRRTTSRTAKPSTKPDATQPTTAPATASKPAPVVRPAPTPAPSTDDGLICSILVLVC